MQDWAVELQRFFTSGTSDLQAIARAARACDDPEIRLYLRKIPPGDDQSFALGKRLVQRLGDQGLSSEATILQLVVYLPFIATADNARSLPIEHRSQFAGLLKGLTDTCRNHAEMVPSLAAMCGLSGTYYRDTRDFAAARGAHEEAVKLAESDQIVGGTPLHLGKGRVSASYRFLLSEARDETARAFALLAAQRDGRARSSAITAVDLAATQSTLAAMRRLGLRPCALLAPTGGADEATMTLGLVTAEDCQWFRVPTEGWEHLLLAGRSSEDLLRQVAAPACSFLLESYSNIGV